MTDETRTALVTGASQGIASAIAVELARRGTAVVLAARRQAELDEVAGRCRSLGVTAHAVAADVSTAAGCDALVAATVGLASRIDILVNTVGAMAVDTQPHVTDFSDEDWYANVDLNLMSGVRLCRAFVPSMVERGWGRIINFSSLVGVEPEPFVVPYSACKAAVIAFTKALARDVGRAGVTANTIIPGLINTPKIASRSEDAAQRLGTTVEDIMGRELKRRPIPVGRPGIAEELAPLVGLLCSDQGAFINGVAIPVDGGAIHGL